MAVWVELAHVKRLAWLAFALLFAVGPCYAARERMDVVLLVDNSGSMYPGRQLPGNDPRYVRATAVQYLLERMSPGDRLALVLFATEPLVPPGAGQLRDAANPETRRILYDGLKVMATSSREGATRMDLGLRRAATIIQHARGERRKRFLILLTDGTPNPQTGNNTYAALTQYARQLGDAGVVIHTIGLGQLSSNPSEAEAARRLLEEMARLGGGAYHPAPRADDLPQVFGAIFAQLVGHAISKPVPPGADTAVLLPPGTTDLRLIAVNRGASAPITLVAPDGTQYAPRQVPPALGEAQEASIATCAVPSPICGRWQLRGRHGAVEVAYEPGFEAQLISPQHNAPWPEATPVNFRVRVCPKGQTAPMPLRNGRVTVEYQREPRGRPQVVPLRQVRPGVGEFAGSLDDPGAPGPHDVTVRCFRRGEAGEEEGGPAYAVLQVGAVPALRVAFPQPNARFALPNPVPVTAQLALGGRPFGGGWSGLRVEATLGGDGMRPTRALLSPSAGGRAVGAISIPRGVGDGKRATLTVALSGTYNGLPVVPQSVTVPLLLLPKPAVQVRWSNLTRRNADPGGRCGITALCSSSCPTPQVLKLSASGLPGVTVAPERVTLRPYQPERATQVVLLVGNVRPGDYAISVWPTPEGPTELHAQRAVLRIHVRTWLEQHLIAIIFAAVVALGILVAVLVGLCVLRSIHRSVVRLLNGVAVYVPRTEKAFMCEPLPEGPGLSSKASITFGGPGSDVVITRPGEQNPVFSGPRMRVEAYWSGRAKAVVTPIGGAVFTDGNTNRVISKPQRISEGGVSFYVGPEKVKVQVSTHKSRRTNTG